MGIVFVSGFARSSRNNPKPSSFGIITSVRTKSGSCSRIASRAARPLGTAFHVTPFTEQTRKI